MDLILAALFFLPNKFFKKFGDNVETLASSIGKGLGGAINGLEEMDKPSNQQDKDDPGV